MYSLFISTVHAGFFLYFCRLAWWGSLISPLICVLRVFEESGEQPILLPSSSFFLLQIENHGRALGGPLLPLLLRLFSDIMERAYVDGVWIVTLTETRAYFGGMVHGSCCPEGEMGTVGICCRVGEGWEDILWRTSVVKIVRARKVRDKRVKGKGRTYRFV